MGFLAPCQSRGWLRSANPSMRAGAARAAANMSDLISPALQRRPGRKRPRLKFESLPPRKVATASGPRRRRASGSSAAG